ncbi:hypothetical protein PF004_g98 [Phytophthora fragariae]|uniref:Uncharacterized protein n=1 Tax=Phytophthora fragariae TaxID=53985 RepID=A0A6G0PWE2_9STRA|nr:hypothetical protein PF004_g98 [Phytophthora fragariae]
MLPNGKKKCVVEGCYRAAYQRRLCPAHGGRDKCRVQDCKNYSYTQGVCQAHSDGKPRTSSRDQKPTSTKAGVVATERDLKASGVDTNTKSHLKKPVASSNRGVRLAETKQSLGEVTMKKRPKLRTKKSLNSDAWKSSDLPNLFRNVDHKRARGTEERVVSTKREKLEISTLGVVETKSRAQVATNKATAVKVARSRPVKTEEGECKFRGCKIPVPSDGFCQKHETRERCKEKGCGHLATSKGLCSRHARRRRCEVDGRPVRWTATSSQRCAARRSASAGRTPHGSRSSTPASVATGRLVRETCRQRRLSLCRTSRAPRDEWWGKGDEWCGRCVVSDD